MIVGIKHRDSLIVVNSSPLVATPKIKQGLKRGAYNLEITGVNARRLVSLVLLICLSYSKSNFVGQNIKSKGIAKYVSRPTESERTTLRYSSFSIGLNGQNWLDSILFFQNVVQELLHFSAHKLPYYLKGMRPVSLVQSTL